MRWDDEIAAGLPPPGPSTPQELRSDILDELSDHLDCAMQRELPRQGDEASARRAVLRRFGSPRLVAARLWLDATKENIMAQRIGMITNVLVAAACLAVAAVAWSALQQTRQLSASILERLEQTAAVSEGFLPAGWVRPTVEVVDAEGHPQSGFEVQLTGRLWEGSEPRTSITATTDVTGRAVFDPVLQGRCSIVVGGPDGMMYDRVVYLLRGDQVERVTWQPPVSGTADVRFALQIPSDLDAVEYVLCTLRLEEQPSDERWRVRACRVLLAASGGALLQGTFDDPLPFEIEDDDAGVKVYRPLPEALVLRESLALRAGIRYTMVDFEVLMRRDRGDGTTELVSVIGALPGARGPGPPAPASVRNAARRWKNEHTTEGAAELQWVLEPGDDVTWTIPLPEPWVLAVRYMVGE